MGIPLLVVLATGLLGFLLAKALFAFFMEPVTAPFQPKKLATIPPKKIARGTAWTRSLQTILGQSSDQERFEHYWSKRASTLAQIFNNTPGVITWSFDGQWHLASNDVSRHQLLQLYACLKPLPQDLSFATTGAFFLAEKDSSLVKLGVPSYALLGVHSTYQVSWMLQVS